MTETRPNPRLSVIIVTCNANDSIEQAIVSVAARARAEGIGYLSFDRASRNGIVETLHRLIAGSPSATVAAKMQ